MQKGFVCYNVNTLGFAQLPRHAGALAQATPNTTCLVVNHENITWNYYRGRDRAFLLAGALFRVGGAAALLSNRCAAENRAMSSCCGLPLLPLALPNFQAISYTYDTDEGTPSSSPFMNLC